MPKKPTKRKAKPTDALTISMHGRGIDIDAKIINGADLLGVLDSLAKRVVHVPAAEQQVHDFDVVLRVVKHADVTALQSIADLVLAELAARRQASASPNGDASESSTGS